MKLYDSGVYLVNGTELVADDAQAAAAIKSRTGREVAKAEAAQGTIAYGILKDHNVSGNMDKLQVKFDKLTSHDITFVGIIQTARASGLEKFPIPYVLTNCHNSLCAVGGTINEDDHMFGLTCAKRYGGIYAASSGSHSPVCQRDAGGRRQDDPRIGFPHEIRSARYHGSRRGRSGAGKAASLQDIRY